MRKFGQLLGIEIYQQINIIDEFKRAIIQKVRWCICPMAVAERNRRMLWIIIRHMRETRGRNLGIYNRWSIFHNLSETCPV